VILTAGFTESPRAGPGALVMMALIKINVWQQFRQLRKVHSNPLRFMHSAEVLGRHQSTLA
jgi:hypothetical protein